MEQNVYEGFIFRDIANKLNIEGIYGGGKIYMAKDGISSGSNERIFTITTKHGKEEFNVEQARSEIGRVQIIIRYESLHGAPETTKLHNT